MIGALLKAHRKLNDIGQREIAKDIGVSVSTLCRIENGKPVDQAGMVKLINWLFQQEQS